MSTLLPKIREWLDSQGFPLEMKAAAAFRAAGFEVRQSSFYTDPETNKNREIDLVALDPDDLGIVNIQFILECKAGKNPWVLLCSRDALRNYNRLFAFAALSKTARHILIDHIEGDFDAFSARIPWIKKEELSGYSLRRAHSEKDTAFEAAVGVAKACNAFIQGKQEVDWIAFAFPVIVIEGPLVRCWLDGNGDVQLDEASEGELLFGHDFGACIRVVTASYLSAFAMEAKRVADRLRSELRSDADQIVESWKSRHTK